MVLTQRGRTSSAPGGTTSLVVADQDDTDHVSSWSIPANDNNILYGKKYHFIEVIIYKDHVPRCIVFGTSYVLSREERAWQPLLQSLQLMKKHGVRRLFLEDEPVSREEIQQELLETDAGAERRAAAFAYNNKWSVAGVEPSVALLRHLATQDASNEKRSEVDAFLLTRNLAWTRTLDHREPTRDDVLLALAVLESDFAESVPGAIDLSLESDRIDIEGMLRYCKGHGFNPFKLTEADAVAFISHGDARKYPYMQTIGAEIFHFRRCHASSTVAKTILDDRLPPLGLVVGASHVDHELRGIAENIRRADPAGDWHYGVLKGIGTNRHESSPTPLYRLPALHADDPPDCPALHYAKRALI